MKKIVSAPYIDQTERWVNGCESISSVMLLQAMGIAIDPDTFIERDLPHAPYWDYDGKLYGPDPYEVYPGDPHDHTGYGCYSPCIVKALNSALEHEGAADKFEVVDESGKTTLALRLKERFGEDEVRLISHDSYYKRHDELPFEERCKLNYDHPDAFDNALLIYHLQELKAGRAIDCPVYDYADHNRSNKVQHIEPAPVLIVEGILPFVEPELCELFDYKIYVDTDADERILRRILRDVKERGRSLDSVIHQYLTTVKPMHEAFVEPSKRNADIIVPNGGENSTAVEMLAHHIRSLIEKANMM